MTQPDSPLPAADRAMEIGGAAARGIVISMVVPVFNEEGSLAPFLARLEPVLQGLGLIHEIVFVNDGSRDRTLDRLLEIQRRLPVVRIVDLSRNFGKEAALTAGIEHARGAAVIPIDCDLQDPPELIPDMVAAWREGYEVVRAQRADRTSDTALKRLSARLFYRVHNALAETPIPTDAGDFCLLDRRVVEALGKLPERRRFMKGLFAWLGYRQTTVTFRREPRRAGHSKWNYWRLWNFALDAIVGFSTVPLRLWTYVGGLIAFGAFLYALFIIGRTLFLGRDLPGYPSLLTVVLFMGGVQLVTLGVIGEYIARIYIEVKQRPLYLVNRLYEPGGGDGLRT